MTQDRQQITVPLFLLLIWELSLYMQRDGICCRCASWILLMRNWDTHKGRDDALFAGIIWKGGIRLFPFVLKKWSLNCVFCIRSESGANRRGVFFSRGRNSERGVGRSSYAFIRTCTSDPRLMSEVANWIKIREAFVGANVTWLISSVYVSFENCVELHDYDL